jgi:hypothetical protein
MPPQLPPAPAGSLEPDGTTLITPWPAPSGARPSANHPITDGPGYDAQPDWSPDGRSVVYSSIETRRRAPLDLAAGTDAPLLAGG